MCHEISQTGHFAHGRVSVCAVAGWVHSRKFSLTIQPVGCWLAVGSRSLLACNGRGSVVSLSMVGQALSSFSLWCLAGYLSYLFGRIKQENYKVSLNYRLRPETGTQVIGHSPSTC